MTRADLVKVLKDALEGADWAINRIWFVMGWAWVGAALLLSLLRPNLGWAPVMTTTSILILVFAQGGLLILFLREAWMRQRGDPKTWLKGWLAGYDLAKSDPRRGDPK